MNSIRGPAQTVVIQDRSRLFREGMQMLLSSVPHIRVVGTVPDAQTLVDACRATSPDGVAFEAAGVPWDVGAVVDAVRSNSNMPVLVGTYPEESRHLRVIEKVSFVPRTTSSIGLVRALQGTAINVALSSELPRIGLRKVSERLTRRELQVLALIGAGLTTAQIADRLGIRPKTVEGRRQSLFAKLGVQNQSHAISVAMREGLFSGGSGLEGAS